MTKRRIKRKVRVRKIKIRRNNRRKRRVRRSPGHLLIHQIIAPIHLVLGQERKKKKHKERQQRKIDKSQMKSPKNKISICHLK